MTWICIHCNTLLDKPTIRQFPIGSMYAIYGNIYHQHTPNVSICTIHASYGLGMFPKIGESPNHHSFDNLNIRSNSIKFHQATYPHEPGNLQTNHYTNHLGVIISSWQTFTSRRSQHLFIQVNQLEMAHCSRATCSGWWFRATPLKKCPSKSYYP